jgi:hypothetical protein
MAWYDGRSDVAHGVLDSVSKADADGAVYWVTHYLMLPILDWLRSHPLHPVRDLTVEMDAIADPAGWQNMVAAIDLPAPPPEPPT